MSVESERQMADGIKSIVNELKLAIDPAVAKHYSEQGRTYTPTEVAAALKRLHDDLEALVR